MSNTDQAQEPSMEEILASIRKIISDDDDGGDAEASDASAADEEVADSASDDADLVAEEPEEPEDSIAEPEAEVEFDVPEEAMDDISADFDVDDAMSQTSEDIDSLIAESSTDVSEDDSEDDDDEVFELTEEIEVAESDAGDPTEMEFASTDMDMSDEEALSPEEMIETHEDDDVVFAEDHDDDLEETPVAAESVSQMGEESAEPLISENSGESIASSFGALENLVMSTQSRTIEDLLQSILRPMLREWLDGNLPPLVERLVREEIERVSRGRR